MNKPAYNILATLTLLASACGQRAPQAPTAVRVGTNRALGTVAPYVARGKGLFRAHGVDVQIVDFADGSPMEAFAAGELDIALLGVAPSAIWQSRGVGLKVVAGASGGGHVLLTRSGAGINQLADLRGRKVAAPKPGTVTDTLFRSHILKDLAGLNPEKDLQILPGVAAADIPAALFVSREVDAAITWEPFASQAEATYRDAKVLFDASAQWRKSNPGAAHLYAVNVVIARQGFIDGRPEDLRRFLAAYAETIEFLNGSPLEANRIIAKEIQVEPAIVASARRRIDYTFQVDAAADLQTLGWSTQAGYLKQAPVAAALFDLRYLPHP